MKTYRLYFSNECDNMEIYQLKNFITRNNLTGQISYFLYNKGSDAVTQMTHFNNVFSKELAEQSVVLPVKLRYFLLVEVDSDDQRLNKFIKGKDAILAYIQENLL